MENIIILILFTYPGAVADYLHGMMIKGKQYDKPAEEYFRIARDFFLSGVISLACGAALCAMFRMPFTMGAIMEALHSGWKLCAFAALTLVGAAATAWIWTAGNKIVLRSRNRRRTQENRPEIAEHKGAWASILAEKPQFMNESIAAVYQDGRLIKAGMTNYLREYSEDEPWITLMWTETTKAELEMPLEKRTLLSDPMYSMVNIENGLVVDLYDGREFGRFIDEFKSSQAV